MRIVRIIFTAAFATVYLFAGARDVADVLREIEKNNVSLQALGKENSAAVADLEVENTIGGPSVEYSPFFRRGADGVASSELVVSQEFDFPTQYAARRKAGKLRSEALDKEYGVQRRDVLLAAKQLCLDIILADRRRSLLEERLATSEKLLATGEVRLANGEMTSIDFNRMKMDMIDVRTELIQNASARESAVRGLEALNSGKSVAVDELSYPEIPSLAGEETIERLLGNDAAVKAAEASLEASRQDVSVSKQSWLPSLTLGYRRNTELDEASNGFIVGASFPIFSSGKKMKAAKIRQAAAELQLDNALVQARTEMKTRLEELRGLEEMMKVYDLKLMDQTLELIYKAVTAGRMSVGEYYLEVDKVQSRRLAYLDLENQRQKLWAEISKSEL